ncbi:MAG: DUF2452 domain-containing protein [Chitinophagales bacterium]
MEEQNKQEPKKQQNVEQFVNPIDKDKIAENPALLPYASNVGSVAIKPTDMGRVKGNAIMAMEQQTDMHLGQIKEQIELLAKQAKAIQLRKEISERIYNAQVNFEPIINHVYHLYERKNGEEFISLIAPKEWGRVFPFNAHLASVRLLADHTWDVLEHPGI